MLNFLDFLFIYCLTNTKLLTADWVLDAAGGFDEFIRRPRHLCTVTHKAKVSQDYPGGHCMWASLWFSDRAQTMRLLYHPGMAWKSLCLCHIMLKSMSVIALCRWKVKMNAFISDCFEHREEGGNSCPLHTVLGVQGIKLVPGLLIYPLSDLLVPF